MARGHTANQQVVGTSFLSPMEDSCSPYFLHTRDHPGLILVSSQLKVLNYNYWSCARTTTFTAKNKIGFVDGSISQPAFDSLLLGIWIHCNGMVISWLLNAVAQDIADSLLYIYVAVEIWNDLCDQFHHDNGLQVFQIKKHLIPLNQGALNVNTYYTRLKIL